MSNNCATLCSYTADTLFLTADNVDEVIPDNFALTPGTQVTVSCNPGYRLVGDATFSCTSGGEWSYSTKPYCSDVENDGIWNDDIPRYYERGREGPSTIDIEIYSRSPRGIPPPPYDGGRYVRDWIKGSSYLSYDDDHIDRSGIYGRHSRDSHLWRNAMF